MRDAREFAEQLIDFLADEDSALPAEDLDAVTKDIEQRDRAAKLEVLAELELRVFRPGNEPPYHGGDTWGERLSELRSELERQERG